MDGNLLQSDTKGAYQVCSECRKGVIGPCWQWTEQMRLYFCCPEHAQEFAIRGGFKPLPEPETETPDEREVEMPKEPGRLRRWWRRLNDG